MSNKWASFREVKYSYVKQGDKLPRGFEFAEVKQLINQLTIHLHYSVPTPIPFMLLISLVTLHYSAKKPPPIIFQNFSYPRTRFKFQSMYPIAHPARYILYQDVTGIAVIASTDHKIHPPGWICANPIFILIRLT